MCSTVSPCLVMNNNNTVWSKLLDMADRTGYQFVQVNGQRIYSSRRPLAPPSRGSEIFIGKLPRDMFEDELIPVFERIGPLYSFRLMIDFTGKNRGFAFACYTKPEDACIAVSVLHNHKIRGNSTIGVYKSLNNCRLFIGNIPENITSYDLLHRLSMYVEGIVDVIMYPAFHNENLNRGYAFVEFVSHSAAAMARRQLAPASLVVSGNTIHVDWADPLPEVEPDVMAQVKILYLSNLPFELESIDLRHDLEFKIGKRVIQKVHKQSNYAFIHFDSRQHAEYAMKLLQNWYLDQKKIEITWARPKSYSKSNMIGIQPNNFCSSVPPRMRRMVNQFKAASTGNESARNSESNSDVASNDFGQPNSLSDPSSSPPTCISPPLQSQQYFNMQMFNPNMIQALEPPNMNSMNIHHNFGNGLAQFAFPQQARSNNIMGLGAEHPMPYNMFYPHSGI